MWYTHIESQNWNNGCDTSAGGDANLVRKYIITYAFNSYGEMGANHPSNIFLWTFHFFFHDFFQYASTPYILSIINQSIEWLKTNVYLSIKEGSLFCSYEIHWTGMLHIVFLVSLESSWRGGVHGLGSMVFGLGVRKFLNIEWFSHWKLKLNRSGTWACFHGVWTWCAKVLKYWMIFSLKLTLNHCWRNWNVPLVLLERSWWAGFNGIYLARFGFKMWERYWF
jgi:hypothetical protein